MKAKILARIQKLEEAVHPELYTDCRQRLMELLERRYQAFLEDPDHVNHVPELTVEEIQQQLLAYLEQSKQERRIRCTSSGGPA